jgi:MFS family permease
MMPLRGLLLSLTTEPVLLVGIQVLDGISGTIFMIVSPLVVADITRGTGRFNVAQGAIGTATAAGAAVSTTVTGFVVDRFGDAAGFCGLAAVALAALVLLYLAMPETRPATGAQGEAPSGALRLHDMPDFADRPPLSREIQDAP